MPKGIYADETIATYVFKWEFLRRNEDYIADYNLYAPNATKIQNNKIIINTYQKECDLWFLDRYGVPPIDPNISLLEILPIVANLKNNNVMNIKKIINESQDILKRLKMNYQDLTRAETALFTLRMIIIQGRSVQSLTSSDELKNHGTIKISVNLDVPKKQIEQEVNKILTNMWAVRQKFINQRRSRKWINLYKEYLQIYDLAKTGINALQIGKSMFPRRGRDDHEVLRDLVRKRLQAAQRLIDGDYRKIR